MPKPTGRKSSLDLPAVMISSSEDEVEELPPKKPKQKLTPGKGRKRNLEGRADTPVPAVGTPATKNVQNKENSAPAAKITRKTLPVETDLTDSSKQLMAVPQQVLPVSNATPKSAPPPKSTNLDQGKFDLKWYEMAIKNNEYFDVILLSSDNIKIPSHRFLLSKYCPTLATIFKESKTLPVEITIKDHRADIIKAVLNFMIDKWNALGGNEFDVMKFALDYHIPCLMDACSKSVEKHIHVYNACQYIQAAYLNDNEDIKKICLKYIATNKNKIDAAEFNRLPKHILIDVIRF